MATNNNGGGGGRAAAKSLSVGDWVTLAPGYTSTGCLQGGGVGGGAGCQYDGKAFLCELLCDGTANAPSYAQRQLAVIDCPAMGQLGHAAIGLPFGCRPHYDGDRFTS